MQWTSVREGHQVTLMRGSSLHTGQVSTALSNTTASGNTSSGHALQLGLGLGLGLGFPLVLAALVIIYALCNKALHFGSKDVSCKAADATANTGAESSPSEAQYAGGVHSLPLYAFDQLLYHKITCLSCLCAAAVCNAPDLHLETAQ